jgi:FtsH-binding integral membrane protein
MWNEEYSTVTTDARDFMYKVYGWMSVALGITAAVAYWVASTPAVFNAVVHSPLIYVLILAQLGLVMFLSWRITTMDYSTALVSFLAYSALSGITFSVYFYIYTLASIYLAFAITAGTFFTMALYGYFTKADLSAMGSFLVMGLFGLIITMFANMWFQSPAMSYYISLIAVGIFTLMTAYDVQKIKKIGQSAMIDPETKSKFAIIGSLTLYLDFINLFIHLLRLFGQRRR